MTKMKQVVIGSLAIVLVADGFMKTVVNVFVDNDGKERLCPYCLNLLTP